MSNERQKFTNGTETRLDNERKREKTRERERRRRGDGEKEKKKVKRSKRARGSGTIKQRRLLNRCTPLPRRFLVGERCNGCEQLGWLRCNERTSECYSAPLVTALTVRAAFPSFPHRGLAVRLQNFRDHAYLSSCLRSNCREEERIEADLLFH